MGIDLPKLLPFADVPDTDDAFMTGRRQLCAGRIEGHCIDVVAVSETLDRHIGGKLPGLHRAIRACRIHRDVICSKAHARGRAAVSE